MFGNGYYGNTMFGDIGGGSSSEISILKTFIWDIYVYLFVYYTLIWKLRNWVPYTKHSATWTPYTKSESDTWTPYTKDQP